MNILVAVNEPYLEPLSVMLYSLNKHNQEKIKVYILHFAIPLEAQKKFMYRVQKWGKQFEIFFLQSDERKFDGVVWNERYQNETNLRLLMLELLPDEINKILWLDTDIIIKGSVKRLYNYPDKGQYAIACYDMFSSSEKQEVLSQLDLKHVGKYFNAGVILFYLKNIRKDFPKNAFLQWMYSHPNKLKYPDQNTLNACLYKKIVWANPEIYNLQLSRVCERKLLKQAKIVHFNTKEKPWKVPYNGYGEFLYWKYAISVLGIKSMISHYLLKLDINL